jgi:hypothetical protein
MLPFPMQGTIVEVALESGVTAEEGQLVCVIEAMRMGNEINRPRGGRDRRPRDRLPAAVASGGTLVVSSRRASSDRRIAGLGREHRQRGEDRECCGAAQ